MPKSIRARVFGSASHPKVHIRPSASISISEEYRLDTPEKGMVLAHMTHFLNRGFSASHNEDDQAEFSEFAEFAEFLKPRSQNKNFAFILSTSRFYELRVSSHQKWFFHYTFRVEKMLWKIPSVHYISEVSFYYLKPIA